MSPFQPRRILLQDLTIRREALLPIKDARMDRILQLCAICVTLINHRARLVISYIICSCGHVPDIEIAIQGTRLSLAFFRNANVCRLLVCMYFYV